MALIDMTLIRTAAVLVALLVAGLGSAQASGTQALVRGDHDGAMAAYRAQLARDPGNLQAAIGLSAVAEARGDLDRALRVLVAAVDAASNSRANARDEDLLAGAVARVDNLFERAAHTIDPEPFLRLADDTTLDFELASVARLSGLEAKLRQGQIEQTLQAIRADAQRITTWSLLGPYGRFQQLDLQRPFGPETGHVDPEPNRYGARGPYRVDTEFADGRVVWPGPLVAGGVAYAISDLKVPRTGSFLLRVSSSSSLTAYLNDQLVMTFDRERERPPRSMTFRVELHAGRHRLTIKSPASSGAWITASLTPTDGASWSAESAGTGSFARHEVTPLPTPIDARLASRAADEPAAAIASWWWLRRRGLSREAGAVLQQAGTRWPDAPIFDYYLADFFAHAETGADAREDVGISRRHALDALEGDPQMAAAHVLLARLDRGAQRSEEALAQAEKALEVAPESVDALFLLHQLTGERGWNFESRQALRRARERAPERMDLLQAAIDAARRDRSLTRLHELLERQATRQMFPIAWARHLRARGELDRARAALETIVQRRPSEDDAQRELIETLIESGDLDAAIAQIDRAEQMLPHASWLASHRAGVIAQREQAAPTQIRDNLERAHAREPANLALLQTLLQLGHSDPLLRHLADPREVLASAPEPGQGVDSALLADIAVVKVDRFGGQTELYQGIHEVYTRAGVEQEGDLQIFPGAQVEFIRIHKPDGRVVDVARGTKNPVHLPGLAAGDAIEYVWRRHMPPLSGIPGALDNQTLFVLQGAQRNFVLSKYVVAHEPDLPLTVCGHFDGLQRDDMVVDGLRVRSYTSREMSRVRPEPHIANRLEITPHVRLSFGLEWQQIGDSIRNALIGNLRSDEPLPQMAARIRARVESAAEDRDDIALARALHEEVNAAIKAGNTTISITSPASASASAGEGNRAGIALALARMLGLQANLVAGRPLSDRGVMLDCPTPNLFGYVLVEIVPKFGDAVYLDYNQVDHPFDRIPSQIAGSDALRIPLDADRSVDVFTLPRRTPPVAQEQRAEMVLDESGRVSGSLTITLRGTQASHTEQVLREMPSDRMASVYRSIAGTVFPGAEVAASGRATDPGSGDLTIDLGLRNGTWGRRTATGYALPVTVQPMALLTEYAPLDSRRYPLFLDPGGFRADSIRIELPEGLNLTSAPDPVELTTDFGEYVLSVVQQGRTVTISRTVRVPPQRVEPDAYDAFRSFARDIAQAERHELILSVDR